MNRGAVAVRCAALVLGTFAAAILQAATITIVNQDAAGEGFSDPTPMSPEGGNNGLTRGQQRLNVFQAAANIWAATLQSNIQIKVGAQFNALSPCSSSGGVLGQAGPNQIDQNFPGAPIANTWYPIALSEALANANRNGTDVEIVATFNSDIDTGCLGAGSRWWYGTNPAIPPAGNTVSLFPVVLHELGHGLGFITLVCTRSGGCGPVGNEGSIPQGSLFNGQNDVWVPLLRDVSQGLNWNAMSNAQRVASMTNDPNLVWTGAQVTAAIPTFAPTGAGVNGAGVNARMRMNGPNPVQPGSSVSHFTSDAASPNLLMEPSLSPGVFNQTDMTVALFRDIGWQTVGGAANQPPVITRPASISVNEDVATSLTGVSVADPDAGSGSLTLTFSVGSGTFNNPGCANVTSGGNAAARTLTGTVSNLNACLGNASLSYTTAANATASVNLTITANDNGNTGTGGVQSDTEVVPINVTAINDPPVNTVPASIAVSEDVPTGLTGISFADVDIATGVIMVTLDVASGSIDSPVCAGVGIAGSATSRRLTGTLAQVNACFAGANRPRFTTASNATANVALTVSSNDNGNTGVGSFGTDSDPVTLTVTAVNDAPSVTLPASIPILAPGTLPLRNIVVADVDAAGGTVTATLSVPTGTLNSSASGGVTVVGSGTGTVVLTGTIANIATYLAGNAVSYTAGGSTTLTVTLNDQGNSGSGGSQSAVAMAPLVRDQLFDDSFE